MRHIAGNHSHIIHKIVFNECMPFINLIEMVLSCAAGERRSYRTKWTHAVVARRRKRNRRRNEFATHVTCVNRQGRDQTVAWMASNCWVNRAGQIVAIHWYLYCCLEHRLLRVLLCDQRGRLLKFWGMSLQFKWRIVTNVLTEECLSNWRLNIRASRLCVAWEHSTMWSSRRHKFSVVTIVVEGVIIAIVTSSVRSPAIVDSQRNMIVNFDIWHQLALTRATIDVCYVPVLYIIHATVLIDILVGNYLNRQVVDISAILMSPIDLSKMQSSK